MREGRQLFRLPRAPGPVTSRARPGFTLIELLITLALVILLVTMLYGPSSRARQAQLKAQCAQNLQHIYVALRAYSLDDAGRLPAVPSAPTAEPPLSLLVPRCTTRTELFICPGAKDKPLPQGQPFADRKISYAYYMGRSLQDGARQPLLSDRQINTRPKAVNDPVFSLTGKKPGNNHHKFGGVFLFCDGQTETSPARAAFELSYPSNVVLLNPKP